MFAELPAPDAIFVGGTGREVARLLEAAYQALRPGGRLVVNVATLESLSTAYSCLKSWPAACGVLLVNVARGTEQLETLRFEAVNPTFLSDGYQTGRGVQWLRPVATCRKIGKGSIGSRFDWHLSESFREPEE